MQDTAGAGGFTLLSNSVGNQSCRRLTGSRAAHPAYSSPRSKGGQGGRAEYGKSQQGRGGAQATRVLNIRVAKALTELPQAPVLLKADTLERGKGEPIQSRTCPGGTS